MFDTDWLPIRDEAGAVAGSLQTLVEVTARHRPAAASNVTECRQAEQALRESEEQQTFLLKLSDKLRPLEDPGEVQMAAMRLLGEHLGANRVAYGEDVGDGFSYDVSPNHVHDAPEMRGRFRYADWGSDILSDLQAGRNRVQPDIANDTRLTRAQREAFAAAGIGASLNVPLVKAGRLVAFIGVNFNKAHDFRPGEIRLVEDVAERTWAAVERARAEKALREGEQRYRTLFDTMGQGYCDLELVRDESGRAVDQRYLELNPAFQRLFGIPTADARGRLASEVMPGLEPSWHDAFDRVVKSGVPERIEHEVATLGRWFEVFAYPRGGDQLTVLYEEVTDRKHAEDTLRASEDRHAFLLKLGDRLRSEADPHAIAATSVASLGEHMGLDRAYVAQVDKGRDRAEIGPEYRRSDLAPVEGVLTLSDFPTAWARVEGGTLVLTDTAADPTLSDADKQGFASLRMGALMVASARKGANNPVWALLVATEEPREWTPGDVALVEETAERTWAAVARARVEAALRESEERFRQFGQASSDVLWIRDAETLQWTYLTPAFETIYGVSRDAALTGNNLKRWAELILPEDRGQALDNIRRVRDGERVSFEYRIVRPSDGKVRWLRNSDFPIRGSDGRVHQIGGTGRDITEEKETSARMEVLVAELQHRTRNLMGVVRSMSDKTVRASADLPDFRARFRDRLEALSRVQGLLSRLNEHDRVTFDDLIETELSALDGTAERVTLKGPADVRLRSSTVQTLAMALHELATNAVKYGALGQPSGQLAITWSLEAADKAGRPWLHIDWRESGVAMPPASSLEGRGGQGRELIERALPYQLGARTTYALGPDGVHCTISVPVSASTMKVPEHA